jgi:hypothetical protein
VSGIDVAQRAGGRIQHAIEDRDEHVACAVLGGNVIVGEPLALVERERIALLDLVGEGEQA